MHARSRRAAAGWLALALLVTTLAPGCAPVTPRIARIGLVAPFEGQQREVGSDVIPAVRLAVREWAALNAQQAGRRGLAFELVAYDDMGDPALAVEQARKLAADPEVLIVIGHWTDQTTQAALPVYAAAGLPVVTFTYASLESTGTVLNLAPSEADLLAGAEPIAGSGEGRILLPPLASASEAADMLAALPPDAAAVGGPAFGQSQWAALAPGGAGNLLYLTGAALPADSADLPPGRAADFDARYRQSSLGAPPGPLAVTAYQAAWLAMSVAADRLGYGAPEGAPAAAMQFDSSGRRSAAPIYLYRWQQGERRLVERIR